MEERQGTVRRRTARWPRGRSDLRATGTGRYDLRPTDEFQRRCAPDAVRRRERNGWPLERRSGLSPIRGGAIRRESREDAARHKADRTHRSGCRDDGGGAAIGPPAADVRLVRRRASRTRGPVRRRLPRYVRRSRRGRGARVGRRPACVPVPVRLRDPDRIREFAARRRPSSADRTAPRRTDARRGDKAMDGGDGPNGESRRRRERRADRTRSGRSASGRSSPQRKRRGRISANAGRSSRSRVRKRAPPAAGRGACRRGATRDLRRRRLPIDRAAAVREISVRAPGRGDRRGYGRQRTPFRPRSRRRPSRSARDGARTLRALRRFGRTDRPNPRAFRAGR